MNTIILRQAQPATPSPAFDLSRIANLRQYIDIPDPLPEIPEIKRLLREGIPQLRRRLAECDQSDPISLENYVHIKTGIALVEHLLEQLITAYPAFAEPTVTAQPAVQNSPTNAETKISAQNSPENQPNVPNQSVAQKTHVSSGEFQVSSSEFDVSSAESEASSAESNSAPTHQALPNTRTQQTDLCEDDDDDEDDDADQQPDQDEAGSDNGDNDKDNEDGEHDQPSIEDYLNLNDDEDAAMFDFHEHLSGKSPLDELTTQQQHAILALMEDYAAHEVADTIAQPPPDGLDFHTTDASLNRFRTRCQKIQQEQANKAIREAEAERIHEATRLLDNAENSDEAFHSALQRLLQVRLLSTTKACGSNTETIDALVTTLTRLRKQALAERKQTHAETVAETKRR